MSDDIVEVDEHREPERRRSDRFVVGALLSGSLVFGALVALARPAMPTAIGDPLAATEAPSVAPLPTATPALRIQPPLFRPATPFPRPSVIPLPLPDVWQYRRVP